MLVHGGVSHWTFAEALVGLTGLEPTSCAGKGNCKQSQAGDEHRVPVPRGVPTANIIACRTFGRARFARGASLEENLGFLRVMLVDLARAGKVVVFVLDEFDLFGRRAKQTALYNLLDAMQAADMQVEAKYFVYMWSLWKLQRVCIADSRSLCTAWRRASVHRAALCGSRVSSAC